jgi:hypothetical protein
MTSSLCDVDRTNIPAKEYTEYRQRLLLLQDFRFSPVRFSSHLSRPDTLLLVRLPERNCDRRADFSVGFHRATDAMFWQSSKPKGRRPKIS